MRLAKTRFPNLIPTDKRSPSRYLILAHPAPRNWTSGSAKSRQQSHSKLEHLQYRFIGFESSSLTTDDSVDSADVAVVSALVNEDVSTLLLSSTDALDALVETSKT